MERGHALHIDEEEHFERIRKRSPGDSDTENFIVTADLDGEDVVGFISSFEKVDHVACFYCVGGEKMETEIEAEAKDAGAIARLPRNWGVRFDGTPLDRHICSLQCGCSSCLCSLATVPFSGAALLLLMILAILL